ncbi:MAG: hypothetical protein SFY69_12525 [Planctomycetota bacterium]|nr:hypothetical protein [Planctomycetota bacterium]
MSHRPNHPAPGRDGDSDDARARRSAREVDRVVNRILDAESEGELHEARRLKKDARHAGHDIDASLRRMRDAVAHLSVMPAAPDMRSRVLAAMEHESAFVGPRERRRISAARAAVCCGVLGAFGAYALVQRLAPQAPPPHEAPVSHLVEAGRADLATSAQSLAQALGTLREELTRPVGQMVALSGRGPMPAPDVFSLGSTREYDVASRFDAHVPVGSASASLTVLDVTPVGLAARPTQRVFAGTQAGLDFAWDAVGAKEPPSLPLLKLFPSRPTRAEAVPGEGPCPERCPHTTCGRRP